MEIQFGERVGHGGCLIRPKLPDLRVFQIFQVYSVAKDKSENNKKSNVNMSPPTMYAPVRVDKKS